MPIEPAIQRDVDLVNGIDAVHTVLRVLTRTTGQRMALVARVTEGTWHACAVLDEAGWGLAPGLELDVATTYCRDLLRQPWHFIQHASQESEYVGHPGFTVHGIESYVAVPLHRVDGSLFGALCALDPLPHALAPEVLDTFRLLADLVAFELESEERHRADAEALTDAELTGELRERFIGVLGHDLRNPLNAISVSASALLRREELGEGPTRLVRRIATSADRIGKMVGDLLDFTRGRLGGGLPISAVPTNARDLAEQVVEELRASHPDRIIELEAPAGEVAEWDPGRIAQTFSNLVANAVSHSPANSAVRVRLGGSGDEIVFETHNRGEPIPGALLPRLFDPFRRGLTDDGRSTVSSGLGLGLYITREIVAAHGGRIEVCSTGEEGTTFRVRLPRRARRR